MQVNFGILVLCLTELKYEFCFALLVSLSLILFSVCFITKPPMCFCIFCEKIVVLANAIKLPPC